MYVYINDILCKVGCCGVSILMHNYCKVPEPLNAGLGVLGLQIRRIYWLFCC